MIKTTVFAALASAVLFAVPAHAEGDAAAGEKVFAKCKACHEVEKGVNKVGPTLKGIVGRAAASVPDYKYSEAMLAKGAEGLVWTEENLTAYLPDPKAYVPKTKMAFAGLKKPEDVANIIAYLKANP
jgi:cytochrome c